MAEYHSPYGFDSYQATPPQYPFATPLYDASEQNGDEGFDDWEYEYSTTETETYYVTLDLSIPEVPPRQHAQQTEKSKPAYWTNPNIGKSQRRGMNGPQEVNAKEDSDADIPPASPDAEDDDADVEAQIIRESGQSKADVLVPKADIRIIDFHTKNPLVSYNNTMYSCKWAENIGTELLFTPHDDTNPLPSLKSLPGDIDLLAASSIRLVSQPINIHKKEGLATPARQPRPEVDMKKLNPALSRKVGGRAPLVRKGQGHFLDSLIKMKIDKGESDRVTVKAKKRQTPFEWKEDLRKRRNRDRVRLRKEVREGNRWEAEAAKERLWEMEQEDEELESMVIPEPEKRQRNTANGQKSTGRPRNREGLGNSGLKLPPRGTKGKGVMVVDNQMHSEGMLPGGFEYGYDAPTPGIPVFYGDEEMYDDHYQGPYDIQYDGLHEEDADGEEDDTHMYGGLYD